MKAVLVVLITAALFMFGANNALAQSTSSANVDGITYKAILYGDQSISIKAGAKTVLHIKRADLYLTFEPFSGLEFKDFNGDGYPDLIIAYKSNIPGRRDLILYDKASKKFVMVPGFPSYPASTPLSHTSFYYSYQKSGCADMNWDSALYKIINYKIVPIGTIAGRGCVNANEPTGISIYKTTEKRQRIIAKLPITALNEYKLDRGAFINHYWNTNYKRF